MSSSGIGVALTLSPKPSVWAMEASVRFARWSRLDAVMVTDHFQDFFPTVLWQQRSSRLSRRAAVPNEVLDTQTVLGHLAGRAGRVRLGVLVTDPIRRHPVTIAQAMATLAYLTRRPPILGIGSGEAINTVPYGLAQVRPVDRLEEALQIIRQCFSSPRPLDFHGTHFQLDGARMGLRPPAGRVPQIWIGAHGPRMLALVGRYGDGWCPTPAVASPGEYADKLAVIRAAAQQAGRDPLAITPSLERYVFVAGTSREAEAMVLSNTGRFFTLLAPASLWRQFGREHPLSIQRGFVDAVLEGYDRAQLEAALKAVPDEMLLQVLTHGTPTQIIEELGGFADAGMRHVCLSLHSAARSRRDAAYAYYAAHQIARALA
jgi:phthiodiolone/phenolphthiodiolone dimycocerosates ketoreductase